MAQDELSVDLEAAAAEASSALSADTAIEEAVTPSAEASPLDSDIDLPDNGEFWNDGEGLDVDDNDLSASDADSSVEGDDVPQGEGIISYKANGKEVKLNLNNPSDVEKLTKDLALVDGARKAFSDKNKLRQKLKQMEADSGDLGKYKESWDKLESIKDDPAELYRVLTGEDFNEMITREAEKRSIYANASEEDRKIMDYEERIRRMEMAQERDARRREQDLEKAEQTKYEAEKTTFDNQLQKEFFKYEFDEQVSPAAANKLKKMLWRNSVADIQDYIKDGYKFSDRMVSKAFKDNASALQAFYKTSVKQTAKAETAEAKSSASQKAAATATKNYKQPLKGAEDLIDKDPLSIFQAFRRGRK